MLAHFVPCADEVHRLQSGSDPECRLAQTVFEQGHYAGRTQPSNTRQGIYAAAPSGVMLASINTNDPRKMAAMLQRALERWSSLSEAERMLSGEPNDETAKIDRPERRYPSDGLVLRVFSRDLPRDPAPNSARDTEGRDWRAKAWNQDYAWFRREEARSLLPAMIEAGQMSRAPDGLLRRLAKFNFIDNVRGQTGAYANGDILAANLDAEVLRVVAGIAQVRLVGETHAAREGTWPIEGFKDKQAPAKHKVGVQLKLFGSAEFDVAQGKFVAFELLALGTRFGATQYNGRHDDADPAPIGYFLTLTGDSPAERVAPSFYRSYGWK